MSLPRISTRGVVIGNLGVSAVLASILSWMATQLWTELKDQRETIAALKVADVAALESVRGYLDGKMESMRGTVDANRDRASRIEAQLESFQQQLDRMAARQDATNQRILNKLDDLAKGQ